MNVAEGLGLGCRVSSLSADTDTVAEIGEVSLRAEAGVFYRKRGEWSDRDPLGFPALAATKDAERFRAAVGDAKL